MRTLYIAGPMRGYALFNFPAFDAAEARARAHGWNVISPAAMDRAIGFDEHRESLDGFDLNAAIERDVAAIMSLQPGEDGIAVLPGWERSQGARAEVALARWRGLVVYDAETLNPIPKEQVA